MTKTPSRILPPSVEPGRLMAELESIISLMPTIEEFRSDSASIPSWRGRAQATIAAWNSMKAIQFNSAISKLENPFVPQDCKSAIRDIQSLLYEARHSLLLEMAPRP